VRLAALTALLALAAPASARAEEGELRYRLVLHGRFTDLQNHPQPTALFDRGQLSFDLGQYLATRGSDAYLSTFASAGLEGRRGWFRWAVLADTGEVRSRSFPRLAQVCPSILSPTGLDVPGSGRCSVALATVLPTVPIEETQRQPAEITSNGRPFGQEARSTLLLREAWVGATLGRNDFALVKAGRQRLTVGDGFIYDDYGLGLAASFDLGALGPSWDLGAAVFYPGRDFPSGAGFTSLMVALRADYLPSLFERVGLFAAFYHDRTGSVAELFRGSLAEPSVVKLRGLTPDTTEYKSEERSLAAIQGSRLEDEAWLGWAGTGGSLRLGRVRLDWTGALVFGHVDLSGGLGGIIPVELESHGSVFGELAHLRVRGSLTRTVEVGGFFLFLSGDQPPAAKKQLGLTESYGGFLGVAPFVTATNIFFNGGVAESFAARQASAPGVNGRGVVAPGLTASWDPLQGLGLDARAAYLVSPATGPFGGSAYGTEVDLEVSWSPLSWLTIAAEGDVLFPGSFFNGRAPVTKVVLGVDLVAM